MECSPWVLCPLCGQSDGHFRDTKGSCWEWEGPPPPARPHPTPGVDKHRFEDPPGHSLQRRRPAPLKVSNLQYSASQETRRHERGLSGQKSSLYRNSLKQEFFDYCFGRKAKWKTPPEKKKKKRRRKPKQQQNTKQALCVLSAVRVNFTLLQVYFLISQFSQLTGQPENIEEWKKQKRPPNYQTAKDHIPVIFFFFLIYRLLMLPPSVCTFASIPGPTVSSIYKVLKEILGCALREGIYTEHLFVLLDRRTLYKQS